MQKEICYKKLFKLMIDRNMKGHDLREKAGISQSTYFKLQHDQPVSTFLPPAGDKLCEASSVPGQSNFPARQNCLRKARNQIVE